MQSAFRVHVVRSALCRAIALNVFSAALLWSAVACGESRPAPVRFAESLSNEQRERIADWMNYMGLRAAGLLPDNDPDRAASAATPVWRQGSILQVIDSLDQTINGVNEVGIQSETAVAVNAAGTVLVGGYNDINGLPAPGNPDQTTLSVSGVARSTDGGVTWAPVPIGSPSGTLPTVTNGSIYGDPDVKYDAIHDRFYYSSIYVRPSDGLQGMGISTSNSDASVWSNPVQVTPTFINGHAGDKPFIDVNGQTGRLMVAWSDFGTSSVTIKTTYSDDGGTTWSPAATLATATSGVLVQAAIPRFVPGNTNAASDVYVIWRDGDATHRNIGCSRSTDGGATWATALDIDSASYPVEDQIEGVDRVASSPSLAVDFSSHRVYAVYQRNDSEGTGHIALRTFTGDCVAGTPVQLSADTGGTRAQFMPWVTVDQSNGYVHVVWYDQGHDLSGDVIEVMHTVSHDQGATWAPPTPLTDRPYHAGFGNTFGANNMGDYMQAVAQNGKLYTLFTATAIEPHFSEGLPSGYLISPDPYADLHLDSDPAAVPLRVAQSAFAEANCALNGNGYIDPGETIALTATVQNFATNAAVGAGSLTGIGGTLSTTTSGVQVIVPTASWSDLAAGAGGSNSTPFQFTVDPSFVPGTPIDLVLTMTTAQGGIQLPIRLDTGTPGAPTNMLSEDFEFATPPALPAGWTAAVGAGTSNPWVTASAASFPPMTTQFAYHPEGTAYNWMRLFSPVVDVPSLAGNAYVSLDFDIAYRLEDEPTLRVQAYDGVALRVTDLTGGTALRSVLAEAFSQSFATGTIDRYPKHLPRSTNANYFQDVSVWSGDSGGVNHVAMRFPGAGMMGRSVQLRFEYTQDGAGVCTGAGYSAPCGVGIDNIALKLVPLQASTCVLTSDLIFRDEFEGP